MGLKAIVSVQWSDISDIGEGLCVEDGMYSVTPLHANLNSNYSCYQEVQEQFKEMLDDLVDENNIDIDASTLYHTIFEVTLNYYSDYYGEVDMEYDLKLIDHEKVGEFDEDNNLTYTDEKKESSRRNNINERMKVIGNPHQNPELIK